MPRISRRGGTTHRSRGSGRLCFLGAAAWLRALRAPRAPAADRQGAGGPSFAASAAPTARARLAAQPSRLRLVAFFRRRHGRLRICAVCKSVSFRKDSVFHFLKKKTTSTKAHRFTCDADMVAAWLLLICSSKAGSSALQLDLSKVGLSDIPKEAPIAEWQTPESRCLQTDLIPICGISQWQTPEAEGGGVCH